MFQVILASWLVLVQGYTHIRKEQTLESFGKANFGALVGVLGQLSKCTEKLDRRVRSVADPPTGFWAL